MLVLLRSSLHSWTRTSLHHLHSPPRVVVVASTNRFLSNLKNMNLVLAFFVFEWFSPVLSKRVDAIDPALRRAGRFDTLVEVSTPNEEDRFKILLVILLTS